MKYISTNGEAAPVSFSVAAQKGLAPDGGLYMPDTWPHLPGSFLKKLPDQALDEIGVAVSKLFIDELDDKILKNLIGDALSFEVPLVTLQDNISILELFHGPSLAFKDFGARFMSHLFSSIRQQRDKDQIILAATSGDTGSAVAQGFAGVEGVQVCLLYPGGKVSHIQEQQLTTVEKNITALEVNGSFDDCQKMVKKAFSDQELNHRLKLTSANSINVARLLPQMFYYFLACSQLTEAVSPPIFCVPSGNLGNLTAGLFANKIGLPATGYIAATNENNILTQYLETGVFDPQPSRQTLSNAMDVGNPSNFARITHLFDRDHEEIKQHIWSASFSDSATKRAIKTVYEQQDYLMDPHTAVGYLAAQKYQKSVNAYFGEGESIPFVVLSTAHPAKFQDVIEPVIENEVPIPERLQKCLAKEKKSIPMEADYSKFKSWLSGYYN